MSTTDRVLTGPRASSLVVCERRAVFEGQGVPREPITPEMQRIFNRGRRIGQMVAQEMVDALAEDGRTGIPEHEVPWGPDLGVGHADLFIPDEGLIVEVVSTAGCAIPEHKARQAAFYALHEPGAENASVLSIDPSTNEEQAVPVNVDYFEDDIMRRVDAVRAGIVTGDLPRRALRPGEIKQVQSPNEWPCMTCPFRTHCWSDWEPEPPGALPAHEAETIAELVEVEKQAARYNQRAPKHLIERRDALRARVGGLMQEREDYVGAGYRLRYAQVAGRRTFDIAAFEAAGHEITPVMEEFIRQGAGHQRWTIKPHDSEIGE